ncbi:type VI secretion system tip protein VgrG [Parapedobacter sp. 10938]|uniref:type VI secretion system tip protein VgrG n=1 Tax=Parapedobacter flavus TaxID=3110225 RepID=UPI002DB948A2|nr:type VI secretion system tip protein VgrG [Parapedobacter sp. 10938]MEC3881890.1 type VI secretion system tip protein VgrG [Parapedobacter sp. 10938]
MPTVHNSDLVTHTVLVGSQPTLTAADELPHVLNVVDIEVESSLNKIPTATLTIADGNPYEQDFEVSSSGLLAPGKFVEIRLGYDGDNITVFKGIITANGHQIQDLQSLFVVTCKHETVRMTVTRNSRYYAEMKDSDVAEQLFSENGISDYDVATTDVIHEQLLQSQVSDWDFMMTRLDVNGLYYSVDGGKIVVQKPDEDVPSVFTLTYGHNIVSFDAAVDARLQTPAVVGYAWDHTNQAVTSSEGAVGPSAYAGSLSTDDLAAIMGKPLEIRLSGAMETQEVQSLTNAKRTKQALAKIKGKVAFSGESIVIPGSFLTLSGLGEQFNGKVFVSAVRHNYADGNWMTEATLGWEDTFFSEKLFPEHPVSFTGQFIATQGLQIGVVTDIIDPAGKGRIKVRLPIIATADEGFYARLATLDAGDNRGTFFMPEVGDEVIVGFLGDDPNYPVVLGMLHSSAKPAPLTAADANNEKGYVSRSGIAILIHDADKRVSIETPSGRKLVLDDAGGVCTMEDASGNKLLFDDSGITLSSAKDLVLKATSSLSIATPQLDIKADATAKVSGAGSLLIESSGITEIKGSMVKIN